MTGHFSIRRLVWAGPLITVLAILANLLFYWLTKIAGEQYLISTPTHPLAPLPVISVILPTLAAACGAVLIFALLLKITHVPLPPFISISAAALLVSFGGPFSLTAETSLATKLLLSAMNIIAGLIIVVGLLFFTHEK